MHDAGEKDTPPSDRLVVARKPLLPTPYARFYSSTRFRSVSAPLPNSDPGAILVAPPLPAARFEANRSSLVSSRITMLENARPFAHPIDPRRVAILWSILPRLEEGQVITRDFARIFFWKDLIRNIWLIGDYDRSSLIRTVNHTECVYVLFSQRFSFRFRKNCWNGVDGRFNGCGRYWDEAEDREIECGRRLN